MTLLALLVPAIAGQLCFTPTDQTAGWKRLDVPDDMPGIAVSVPPVDQYRVGEAAWLLDRDPSAYEGMRRESIGRTTYRFRLPKDAKRLDVRFAGELRGAKVDAVALAEGRQYVVFDGHRMVGIQFSVWWEVPGVDAVEITVHQHLRPVPVVSTWMVARWVDIGAEQDLPSEFRVARSLYYRHPGGRTVEVCNLPSEQLSVERGSLKGRPESVLLHTVL